MKRAFVISLVILYFVFSGGIVLSAHFCNGSFDKVSLFTNKRCCPDSDQPGSCCDNTASILKIEDSYDSDRSLSYLPKVDFSSNVLLHLAHTDYSSFQENVIHVVFERHRYRFKDDSPVYLVNRVLII